MEKNSAVTDISQVIGKNLAMEVAEGVDLEIVILSETEVQVQFVGVADGSKDDAYIAKLEVAFDDIDGVSDYSFLDSLGVSKFFLFQFQ